MALDLNKLENLFDRGDSYESRCPACAVLGGDSARRHLFIFKENHAYHCVARGADPKHNRQIFGLVGIKDCARSRNPIEFLSTIERKERNGRERELIDKYRTGWPRIRDEYAWSINQITDDDPSLVSLYPPQTHWRWHLSLFQPDDLLWIGERYDSGDKVKPYSFVNQRNLVCWPNLPVQVPLTTSAVFKPGATSRCDGQVLVKKYLVVESDTLSKEETGAVFSFVRKECGLHLWMVVDTGGSSIHGHFSYPPNDQLFDLKARLSAWGCDPAMFTLSQPCRLAGVTRKETGRWQKIIYFHQGEQGGGANK